MKISGIGCALVDYVYNGIDFRSDLFLKYSSVQVGDGGLSSIKLVFTDELEHFTGKPYLEIIDEITRKKDPDIITVGVPSLVSLIHAAQLTYSDNIEVKFYGLSGNDDPSGTIRRIIDQTPLNSDNYLISNSEKTPFTYVLSDPDYNNAHREWTFINSIGAAGEYKPDMIDSEFFNSQITCFGDTTLVPQIHDNLTELLTRAKQNDCVTLVNTVFDFRNEKKNPGKPWPLVKSTDNYDLIDILIMDGVEAIKISGRSTIEDAALYFSSTNLFSFIITNGADNIYAWSGGTLFKKEELIRLPVSHWVRMALAGGVSGDTTGCGDNFAGGVISSLAWQLKEKGTVKIDLLESITFESHPDGIPATLSEGLISKQNPEKSYPG